MGLLRRGAAAAGRVRLVGQWMVGQLLVGHWLVGHFGVSLSLSPSVSVSASLRVDDEFRLDVSSETVYCTVL